MSLLPSKSKSLSGRLSGTSLAAFEHLQQAEGLKQSETFAQIVTEWVALKAGAPLPARYAAVDPGKLNLALGSIVELSRSIQNAQKALRAPRPILPGDEAAWRKQMEAANQAFASTDTAIEKLSVTAKVLQTEKPDRALALGLAKFSYKWTGGNTEQYRELVLSLLRPFIGDVTPPVSVPPKLPQVTGAPQQAPFQPALPPVPSVEPNPNKSPGEPAKSPTQPTNQNP